MARVMYALTKPAWVDEVELGPAWWDVHCAHPEIAAELYSFTRRLLDRGYTHVGISLVWETLRYFTMLGTGPEEDVFRLNNNHRAYYARWLMETYPDLEGVFSVRAVRPRSERVAA